MRGAAIRDLAAPRGLPFCHRLLGAGGGGGQPVVQLTVGHVHWPLGETVNPQLLPLPLGLAVITYWLGQEALTFQVV